MEIVATAIPEIKIVTTRAFYDERGYFTETWNRRVFAEALGDLEFVQDNHSLSHSAGTLRGLHFQAPPAEQTKLVRCPRGRVYDVAVDIRHGSPGFGRHVAVELSAENRRQLLIPAGFAHGFLTLEPDTEVIYKVTGYYSRQYDLGIAWDDPDLAIDWPLPTGAPLLSDRDAGLPRFADLPAFFHFGATEAAISR